MGSGNHSGLYLLAGIGISAVEHLCYTGRG